MSDHQDLIVERARRGAVALPALPPPDPDSEIATSVLGVIPDRLGLRTLSPIFAALSNWPASLQRAWAAFAPLIDTPAYLHAVAAVRAQAPTGTADIAASGDPRLADLHSYLDGQHRVLPELLLLATAWYRAADGKRRGTPAVEGPPPPPRVLPPAMDSPPAPTAAAERLLVRLAEAHGHPRVLSVYKVMAGWDATFGRLAPAMIDVAGSEARSARLTRVRHAAAAAADDLPLGSLEFEEGALEILALFGSLLIPDLLLDTAFALDELGAAPHSPVERTTP